MQYSNPYIELCIEGSSSIFKGLSQKEKESFDQHHTVTHIKKGGHLFKEGDKTHGLICLSSGKVKIFKVGVGGREQILKMIRQQGLIGYRVLFTENVWSFSAVAIEDSSICTFEKNSFNKILKKNADFSLRLAKAIADELFYSTLRTISLTQKHVRGRLAESLLVLLDTYGYEADGKTMRATLSREDIAHLSNMTTSNAIRTLSNMASEKIIELSGKKISILDLSNLEYISEHG